MTSSSSFYSHPRLGENKSYFYAEKFIIIVYPCYLSHLSLRRCSSFHFTILWPLGSSRGKHWGHITELSTLYHQLPHHVDKKGANYFISGSLLKSPIFI